MTRPEGLPPAEHYSHGTRARYVSGCHCDECKASNRRYYHERQARAKEAAAQIETPDTPVPQLWTAPDGTQKTRIYKRACPGVHGQPCPKHAHLRKDSKGGVCGDCRMKLAWNGLVDAAPARRRLRYLSRMGVGYRSAAIACDVGRTLLADILSGSARRIRKEHADRILAVTKDAIADHTIIPAGPTMQLINELLERGYSKADLARRLGYDTLALQIKGEFLIASNALKVRRLHKAILEGREPPPLNAAMARRVEEMQADGSLRQLEIADEFGQSSKTEFFSSDQGYSFWKLGKIKNDDIEPLLRKLERDQRRP